MAEQTLDDQIAALQAKKAQLALRDHIVQALAAAPTEQEKDEAMLRIVGGLMEQRLAAARAAGRTGWHTTECSADSLRALLAKNAGSGDFLDTAVFAAMLVVRGALAIKE